MPLGVALGMFHLLGADSDAGRPTPDVFRQPNGTAADATTGIQYMVFRLDASDLAHDAVFVQ